MESRRNSLTFFLAAGGVCLLLPGLFLALGKGAMELNISDIWQSILNPSGTLEDMLILDVRIPRAICVMFTGGILGMTGALMQGVTRNPIAEPALLGISQAATLAVACLYAAGIGLTAANTLLGAMLGALAGGILIVCFTLHNPGNMSVTRLLLAGTAMSIFFTAITTVVGLLSNQSQMIAFWVSGGFRNTSWTDVKLIVAAGIIGIIPAIFLAPRINIISLGDETAAGLGENPQKVRLLTFLLLIPLCAAAVTVGKTIGFVGLMIPQIVRLIVGEDYRRIIPCSFLLGAVLLTYADVAARLLYQPYEIPIGIFTALLGVPFFLFMAGRAQR